MLLAKAAHFRLNWDNGQIYVTYNLTGLSLTYVLDLTGFVDQAPGDAAGQDTTSQASLKDFFKLQRSREI
jgi:hypothetical protein